MAQLQLVACATCHRQYDVAQRPEEEIACACGGRVSTAVPQGIEAAVCRCSSCGAQVGQQASACDYCGAEVIRDTRRLSLICPECHARNPDAARFCTACSIAFEPEESKLEGDELPCPCCGFLMAICGVGGIAVSECPECNGLWAPEDRFDRLVARAFEAAKERGPAALVPKPRTQGGNPASQRVQYRKCPVCEAFMQRKNYQRSSGVILDRCRDHGTWLDADELEQITGFLLTGGRPQAQSHFRENEKDVERARVGLAKERARDLALGSRALRSGPGAGMGRTIIDVLSGLIG